jgi:hypothetical protein
MIWLARIRPNNTLSGSVGNGYTGNHPANVQSTPSELSNALHFFG